jgi:putative membrane protein
MPKVNLDFLPRSLTIFQTALLTLWVLLMVSFPIVDWTLGWEAMLSAVVFCLLAQLVVVLLMLWHNWGTVKTLGLGLTVLILSWIAEALGSHASFPFGAYSYTGVLQPQIFNVPLLVPLGWLIMLPPSWGVAQAIANQVKDGWQAPVFIGLSALAMTAWDLMIDPMMVTWGMWVWENPGAYFGIPWGNFLGWLLTAGLITAIIRPADLPIAPLLLVYTITWLLMTAGLGLFWGMPGPALIGGMAMGVFSVVGWRVFLKESR